MIAACRLGQAFQGPPPRAASGTSPQWTPGSRPARGAGRAPGAPRPAAMEREQPLAARQRPRADQHRERTVQVVGDARHDGPSERGQVEEPAPQPPGTLQPGEHPRSARSLAPTSVLHRGAPFGGADGSCSCHPGRLQGRARIPSRCRLGNWPARVEVLRPETCALPAPAREECPQAGSAWGGERLPVAVSAAESGRPTPGELHSRGPDSR